MIPGTDMHQRTKRITGLLAALLLSTVAAAQPAVPGKDAAFAVKMTYDPGESEAGTMSSFQASPCVLHIAPASDARQNKETIGQSFSGPLLAEGVSSWMTEGLKQLKAFGYTIGSTPPDGTPAADGLTVRTTLTRAYTWHVGMKIFSMVAVKAEFADRNGVLQQKYYRSHGDKTNMWGAQGEYVTTLNYGLNNLLPFLARDMQSLCKGEKVEGYTYAGPDGLPK